MYISFSIDAPYGWPIIFYFGCDGPFMNCFFYLEQNANEITKQYHPNSMLRIFDFIWILNYIGLYLDECTLCCLKLLLRKVFKMELDGIGGDFYIWYRLECNQISVSFCKLWLKNIWEKILGAITLPQGFRKR